MTELLPEFARGSLLWEAVFAASVLAASVVVAFVADRLLFVAIRRIIRRTRAPFAEITPLADMAVNQLHTPFILLLLAAGAFIAASSVTFLADVHQQITRAWVAAVIALAVWSIQRAASAALRWYEEVVSSGEEGGMDTKLLLLLRRVLSITLLAVGTLLVLDSLGIEVSPLLAGLGIGGLAVALALQPTLSNFFAGTYMVSGNVVKMGDFIEMEGGVQGYVVEVGWRSTRIRTLYNNLVIIPNSRLADSVLTNYYGPSMEMGVMVMAGVSYSSSLAWVRKVALEVASQVVKNTPEAVKEEPWFGFDEFADSNVNFWVWVQATDRISSFMLKSELILRLHERFAEEGIEINYPVRKLVFPDKEGAPALRTVRTSTREKPAGAEEKPAEGQGAAPPGREQSDQGTEPAT